MNHLKPDKAMQTAWLQISAGQGPKECAWVVAQVVRRLIGDSAQKNITTEVVESLAFEKVLRHQDLIDTDAYRSCLLRLQGPNVNIYAQQWLGAIKWHGVSPYRPKHKRCNWFVGVESVGANGVGGIDTSIASEIYLQQLARDVDVVAVRAGGPGGQHVNKTSSAVRITHRPTGLQIKVESSRSQHRNRQLALERLQLLLVQAKQAKSQAQIRDRWLQHYQVKRGNPVRVFKGLEFNEVL